MTRLEELDVLISMQELVVKDHHTTHKVIVER